MEDLPQELYKIIMENLKFHAKLKLRLLSSKFNNVIMKIIKHHHRLIITSEFYEEIIDLIPDYYCIRYDCDVSDVDVLDLSHINPNIIDIFLCNSIFGKHISKFDHLQSLTIQTGNTVSMLMKYLDGIQFERLELTIGKQSDLQYLRSNCLTLTSKNEIKISQYEIDQIGCNFLLLVGEYFLTGEIVISHLELHDCIGRTENLVSDCETLWVSKRSCDLLNSFKCENLKRLSILPGDDISGFDYSVRESLINLHKCEIEMLKLQRMDLKDCLQYFSHIKYMSLEMCLFEDDEILHLKDCKRLNLNYCRLEGIYLKELNCISLTLSNCKNIDVSYITDKYYEYLDLSISAEMEYNPISSGCLPHAKNINISGRSEITDSHLERLQESTIVNIMGCNIQGHGLLYLHECETLNVNYCDGMEKYLNIMMNTDETYCVEEQSESCNNILECIINLPRPYKLKNIVLNIVNTNNDELDDLFFDIDEKCDKFEIIDYRKHDKSLPEIEYFKAGINMISTVNPELEGLVNIVLDRNINQIRRTTNTGGDIIDIDPGAIMRNVINEQPQENEFINGLLNMAANFISNNINT